MEEVFVFWQIFRYRNVRYVLAGQVLLSCYVALYSMRKLTRKKHNNNNGNRNNNKTETETTTKQKQKQQQQKQQQQHQKQKQQQQQHQKPVPVNLLPPREVIMLLLLCKSP